GDGNLAEESLYADGGRLQRTVFKRDRQGRLLEATTKSSGGSGGESKSTYKYADGSEPISSTHEYFPGRPVTEHYAYDFDSRGNWIKRRSESSGQFVERTIGYYSSDAGPTAQTGASGIPGESPTDPLQPTPLSALPKVIRKSGGILQSWAIRKVEP